MDRTRQVMAHHVKKLVYHYMCGELPYIEMEDIVIQRRRSCDDA